MSRSERNTLLPPIAPPLSRIPPGISRWLPWVMAGALGVVLAWALVRPPRAPAVLPEASLPELTRVDGRLWRAQGGEKPFTGFLVERYDSGALKTRSSIRDGLLDGISEGWFTNGVLQVREPFRKGVSHGQRIKWHPNGSKLSEATIVDGQLDGWFRRWNEGGTLAEEIQMKRGEPEGISRAYFPSGFVKTEVLMAQGKVVRRSIWNEGEFKEAPLAGEADGAKQKAVSGTEDRADIR